MIEEVPPGDWDYIEADYKAGILSEAAICKKHHIGRTTLDNAASSRGWTRVIMSPEDEATVLTLADQGAARFPIDSICDPDEIKKQVLITAGQIVRIHRTDIAKMRGMSVEIMNRLNTFLETGDTAQLLFLVGKNDTAADLLEKLSRVLERTVKMERQAFGLENMTIVPDEEADNQVAREIRILGERLRLITEQKAQRADDRKDHAPEEVESTQQELPV